MKLDVPVLALVTVFIALVLVGGTMLAQRWLRRWRMARLHRYARAEYRSRRA